MTNHSLCSREIVYRTTNLCLVMSQDNTSMIFHVMGQNIDELSCQRTIELRAIILEDITSLSFNFTGRQSHELWCHRTTNLWRVMSEENRSLTCHRTTHLYPVMSSARWRIFPFASSVCRLSVSVYCSFIVLYAGDRACGCVLSTK